MRDPAGSAERDVERETQHCAKLPQRKTSERERNGQFGLLVGLWVQCISETMESQPAQKWDPIGVFCYNQ
jgi:hypothetical protein